MTVQFQFIRTTHENGDFDRLNASDFDKLNASDFTYLNAGDFTPLNASDFTHLNAGGWRSFSPEALTFWQQHGSVVGAVLRPETPLTFAQLLTACREYALDHISDGPQPELVTGYVAWVLVHLIHYGMAATVPAFPAPPVQKLNWTVVYPAAAASADHRPASRFSGGHGQSRH